MKEATFTEQWIPLPQFDHVQGLSSVVVKDIPYAVILGRQLLVEISSSTGFERQGIPFKKDNLCRSTLSGSLLTSTELCTTEEY